jgi:uncharacterized protein (DUF1800 family)
MFVRMQAVTGAIAGAVILTAAAARLQPPDHTRQLVERLTFGARPSDLADARRVGVSKWIDRQLHPDRIPDPVVDSLLALLPVGHETAFELAATYPAPSDFGLTVQQGLDTADHQRVGEAAALGRARYLAAAELPVLLLARASLSNRQLLEVMTEFWENHFSVNAAQVPAFALVDYDRTIRQHALGEFRDLLGAVARTPAMLFYLDNYRSIVDSLHPTADEWRANELRGRHPPLGDSSLILARAHRGSGINENYGRELMELHTLGVNAGYTQKDVQEVARCFTGWGVDDAQFGGRFAFHALQHDAGEKTVLGVHIPGGRGIEDGEEVLDILARSPATAHFIARKLAVHFVSDDPPPTLVERASKTYMKTGGDIGEVLRTIFASPEFYASAAYRAKVKTPFDLVASTMRVMDAAPDTTQRPVQLVARLGQTIFGHVSPEGWPDQGDAWMNAGALIARVNLATQVGANQFPNVTIAKWPMTQRIDALPVKERAAAVANALLAVDPSPATLDAMRAVPLPLETATEGQRMAYIGSLVAIALGSPEFQRR